jgi:oxalate decarboxylase/phosphoglucose isomerase-like protein (cupin superfamily)
MNPKPHAMLGFLSLTLASPIFLPKASAQKPANPVLGRELRSSLTYVDFWNTLSDADFVYDFSKASSDPYHPGSVLNCNAASFPLLTNSGMTVAQLNLGPCAMLAQHLHPRANNVVVAVSGRTKTYMRAENGARDRITELTPGKVTMFPRGSMHAMVNEGTFSFVHCPTPYPHVRKERKGGENKSHQWDLLNGLIS